MIKLMDKFGLRILFLEAKVIQEYMSKPKIIWAKRSVDKKKNLSYTCQQETNQMSFEVLRKKRKLLLILLLANFEKKTVVSVLENLP